MTPRAHHTTQESTSSDDSSSVDINKYGTYMHMRYDGRDFYANREHHSAASSEQGMALFNDNRRVDQFGTESTLSPLTMRSHEVSKAVTMAQLMEIEFKIDLFA